MTTPSGPGQFSQRTDKAVYNANNSLPNAGYGENADYQDIKSGAPMAKDAGASGLGALLGGGSPNVVGLSEESNMPDVPVTDGAASGPGAGMEALGLPDSEEADYLVANLPALEYMANTGRSDAARNLIRKIKYSI